MLWIATICLILYLGYILLHAYLSGAAPKPWSLEGLLQKALRRRNIALLTEDKPFWFLDLSTAGKRAARAAGNHAGLRWDFLTVALLGTQSLAWIAAVIAPLHLSEILPRAIFVVAMLALPISLSSFISTLSHLWRVPLVLLSFAILIVLSGMAERFHDLRTVEGMHGLAQTGLLEAVASWRAANCPEEAHDGKSCQARPVIVASAGGASRAAFFTATVVGEILDRPEVPLRNRLFAISGVSGGSVGAVMIRAALEDAGPGGQPPCAKLDDRWFGPYQKYGKAPDQKPITWRNCLQTLLAGDFLSPAFIGLTFRDMFGFLPLDDRAALLELSFERRYNRIVRGVAGEEGSSLGRFVGEAAGQSRSAWVPLLLLNATSVKEGRRSIISDLRPYVDAGGQSKRIFPMAFDVLETLGCEAASCGAGSMPVVTGIRLSTAAAASARFPLISPQANVRRGGKLRDLLVDGGYFENDGLTTARELAEALVEAGLRPVIVHITNNPVSDTAVDKAGVPLPAAPRPVWYEALSAPFEALYGTRDGHALEALNRAMHSTSIDTLTFQVRSHVPKLAKDEACTIASKGSIDTREPPMNDLSMSWWLSGAVQGYLDRQLCHPSNVENFGALSSMISAE
ncbi:hypothetical protein R1A27_32085 (plasmid) [Methylobacterium sp. NMS12]|uniref:hypothetical protein n=1 Tax=Methylobacterium sp. NMS12 TaxID=3079766 RepID=UPI003F883531